MLKLACETNPFRPILFIIKVFKVNIFFLISKKKILNAQINL